MLTGILIALGAGSFWTLSGVMNSCCARFKLSIITYLFSNMLCSFLLSWIFLVRYRAFTVENLPLAGVLVAAGFLNVGGMLLLQHALSAGHHGIVFLITQSAIVFPFLAGLLLFGERPSAVRICGCIGIFLGMACCSLPKLLADQKGKQPSSGKWLILSLCSLLAFGMAQILMTLPSWRSMPDPANLRTAGMYTGCVLMMCCYSLFSPAKFVFSRLLVLCGITVSILSLFSMVLMFLALDALAKYGLSAVGFPLAIASSMVGFTLYSILIMKERCYPSVLAGLLLIISGGVMIAL